MVYTYMYTYDITYFQANRTYGSKTITVTLPLQCINWLVCKKAAMF
jgi:hypothetical protein